MSRILEGDRIHARERGSGVTGGAPGEGAGPVDAGGRGFPLELVVVWLVFLTDAIAMFVTLVVSIE